MNSSFSQYYIKISPEKADSLKILLDQVKEGEERIDIMNLLTEYYAWFEPEKFDSLNNVALELSQDHHYAKGEGLALYNKGFKNYIDGDFQQAISNYQEALRILEQTNDLNALALTYERLGVAVFLSDTDKQKGIDYCLKMIDLYQRSGNKEGEAIGHFLMSGAYFRVNKSHEGLESIKKYWEIRPFIHVPGYYDGIAYAVEAECYERLGDMRKSLDHNLKAVHSFDTNIQVDRSLKAQIASIVGDLYLMFGNHDSAVYFFDHSIRLGASTQNAYQSMRGYFFMAKASYLRGDHPSARQYCRLSLTYADFIDSTTFFYLPDSMRKVIAMSEEMFFPLSSSYRRYLAWEYMNSVYQLLWEIYSDQGLYKETFIIHKPWMKIRDHIAEFRKDRDLLELNISYETERKEQQLDLLTTENSLNALRLRQTRSYLIVLTAFILMIVVIAILLIRQNRMNARNKTIILEQRLLRAQMDPHFLFNSLSSVQGFMMENDVKAANRYLSMFAGLIRNILDNSQEELVLLIKEINTIRYYLELQQVRYEGKFDFDISIDEDLDTETMEIPPMLAQPFIENAIEHGIKNKETKGHIQINFVLDAGYIVFEVIDDGIGRERSEQLKSQQEKGHRSLATTITRERIAVLNKKHRSRIRFKIVDLRDDSGNATGTRVVIRIPEVSL